MVFLFIQMLHCEAQDDLDAIPEMIFVKGGKFKMGDVSGAGDKDELPARNVLLKSYNIAKTEITVRQWKQYCSAEHLAMPATPAWGWIDDQPVVNISWSEASTYCQWLTKKTGKVFRLPTEAEWEFAAKGGNKSKGYKFSGGNDVDKTGFYKALSPQQTQPVGRKLPNEIGLYDMSGNVWEWCADWYDEGYPDIDFEKDPKGIPQGKLRIIRGGGWVAPANDLRVTNRWRSEPEIPRDYLGLRPVMEN